MKNKKEKEYFEYLDTVRDTGGINMFAAGRLLEEEFGLDRRKAKEVLLKWMKNFK